MRKLNLYLKNKLIQSVDMTEDKPISVGRQPSCSIVIDDNSISREHLLFSFENDAWKVVCKSRFDCLEDDYGNSVKEIIIPETDYEVNINKYKLIVLADEIKDQPIEEPLESSYEKSLEQDEIENNEQNMEDHADTEAQDETQDEEQIQDCLENDSQNLEHSLKNIEDIPESIEEEVTKEIALNSDNIKPFITIKTDTMKKTFELFESKNNEWIFGRGKKCGVKLNSKNLSNKHFKIRRDVSKYYITDLRSTNGTNVNGVDLNPNQETELVSGSVIKIKLLTIQFDLKDSNIQQQLVTMAPRNYDPIDDHSDYMPTDKAVKIPVQKSKKNNKVKVIAVMIIIISLALFLMEDKQNAPEQQINKDRSVAAVDTSIKISTNPFDNLDSMQKQLVVNSYELASKMYKESKYNIAISEIKKIHKVIPSYQDSKMIESLSLSAIETLKQQEEIAKMEEEQKLLKQRSDSILDRCEQLSKTSYNKSEIQSCLEEVASIDPDNSRISAIIQKVDSNISDRKIKEDQKNKQATSIRMGENLYKRAKNLHTGNKLLDAIDAYNKHINSNYQDPNNLKSKSRQAISEIKSSISSTIASNIENAAVNAKKGNYKRAIAALRNNLYLDPDHKQSRDQIVSYVSDLRQKTRSLFQNAIMEENMGNLESAKEKWKQITQIDIPDGEYMKKAKIKLKKYGI